MNRRMGALLSVTAMLLCCGCELQEGAVHVLTGDTAAELESLDNPYIGMVLKSLDGQFYPMMKAGAEAEADRLGAEVIVVAPDSEENAEEQAEIIRIMADMALDVLAIAPCEEELFTDSLARAEQNGKILLAVDEKLEYSGCAAYIGSDNTLGGQREGTFAAQIAVSDTAVILRGSEKSRNHTQRVHGLEQSLNADGISVLACRDCKSSRAKAYDTTWELLDRYDSIGVICATNDSMAIGASRAVQEAGSAVPVVSFDGTPEVLELVRDGVISGTIVQDAYQIGVRCVDTAVALYRGEEVEDTSVPMVLVTPRTAEYYLSETEHEIDD